MVTLCSENDIFLNTGTQLVGHVLSKNWFWGGDTFSLLLGNVLSYAGEGYG